MTISTNKHKYVTTFKLSYCTERVTSTIAGISSNLVSDLDTESEYHESSCLLVATSHGDVERACTSTWNREGYTEVGIKGTRASVALWASKGRVILGPKQRVHHTIVAKEMVSECLCSKVFIGSVDSVLIDR